MSDRTQGSVRTDSRDGDGSAAAGTPAGEPVTSTQSIPTTGTQRAQAPGTGAAPLVPQPLTGATAAAAPSAPAHAAPPQAAPAAPTHAAPPQVGSAAQEAPAPTSTGPISSVSAPAAAGAAPTSAASTGAASTGAASRGSARTSGRGPRRARLQLRHIDTWSALKISLVLSISLFFIWMVAVGLLYLVLNGLGVFDTINGLVGQLGTASGDGGGSEVLTPGVVFGGAAIIGAINVVLLTALCTVGTFMYNLCSDLVGGLEVTLSERD